MKEEKDIKLFVQSFCGKDKLQPNLNKPTCYDNGLVIATDAHILLAFEDSEWHKKYPDDSFMYDKDGKIGVNALPLLQPLWDKYSKSQNTIGTFKMSESVQPVYDSIRTGKYRHLYIDCHQCDGFGELQCDHCGSYYECELCNGSGRLITNPNNPKGYRIHPDSSDFFVIKKQSISGTTENLAIAIPVMSVLFDAMQRMSYDEVELMYINTEGNKREAFMRIKDTEYYILIMGVLYMNADETSNELLLCIYR